jgi:hypothetical protein
MRKVLAKSIPDFPWMVRGRPYLDLYTPKRVLYKRSVIENVTFKEEMTAEEARKKGFELDPGTNNKEILKLEWTEAVPKKIGWTELRLDYRSPDKCLCRGQITKMRAELAYAAESPFALLPHQRLAELIENETEHWKENDMFGKKVHPIILSFLEINEDEESETDVKVRDTFYITKYSETSMEVSNSSDQTFEIEFEKGVVASGIVRRFILFLPSNVHLFDPDDGKRLL